MRLAAGIERRRRNGIIGRYAVIGDYRYVRDLQSNVEARWRRPYLGIEVAERWRRVTATESFGTRINGIDAGALARVLGGDRSWTQVELDAHAGRRLGRASGQLDVGGFAGHDLDVVNAFLIGGSWHLADPRLVSGYRFGEDRLTRAATANARAGVRVAGTLEVGVRASVVAGENLRRNGAGVELRAVYSGVVIDVGVAWAGSPDSSRERRPVFYGQFTTAILQP
jgi:hypothetical protein